MGVRRAQWQCRHQISFVLLAGHQVPLLEPWGPAVKKTNFHCVLGILSKPSHTHMRLVVGHMQLLNWWLGAGGSRTRRAHEFLKSLTLRFMVRDTANGEYDVMSAPLASSQIRTPAVNKHQQWWVDGKHSLPQCWGMVAATAVIVGPCGERQVGQSTLQFDDEICKM